MTNRIFITVEYDGGPFVGWQRQDNGLSVQQVLEDAAAELTGGACPVQGAGRTDSGVHATGQVAHLDVPEKFDANRVMTALNALTAGHPVTIREARRVPDEAHARFSATGRRYLYRILARRQPPALDHGRVWHHRAPLEAGLMQAAADRLVGRHDFTSFRASQCQADSPLRTLDELRIEMVGEELHLHAAPFVPASSGSEHRRHAGACRKRKWTPDDVTRALEARHRAAAGPTAPPEGLYLTGVVYPSGI